MPSQLSDRAQVVSPLPLYTVAEARMLGIHLNGKAWMRLRKGVYVDRLKFEALPVWKRYAVRVHAFVVTHPDAVLCLESAAVLHGIPHFGETKDIHVYDPDGPSSWRHRDVSIHTSRDPRTVEFVNGVQVTGLCDTVVDLARVVPPAHGLAMVDAAISPVQGGFLRLDSLRERSEGQENQRGRARLRWLWENGNALSESPAESVSRAVIAWSGFEQPELQRKFFYEGEQDRVDFFFRSCGVVGESDGWGKYNLEKPKEAEQHLADEKRREDRLRRNGHPFARWDLKAAWQVDPLCEALSAVRVPLVAPRQPMMLATLSSNPRAKPWKRK